MDIKLLMRQAQEMQKKMQQAQEELSGKEYEGSSGGGMINVTLLGNGTAKKVNIDASLLVEDEKEILEDLLVAAFNDAKQKADESSANLLRNAAGGMNLPAGLKF